MAYRSMEAAGNRVRLERDEFRDNWGQVIDDRADARQPAALRRALRILLVEPDAMNRRALAALLRGDGNEVVDLAECDSAGAVASGCDLLISELSIPGRREFDTMCRLRDSQIKGILLTAHEARHTAGWERAAFSAVLYKPAPFDDLRATIARLFPPRKVPRLAQESKMLVMA